MLLYEDRCDLPPHFKLKNGYLIISVIMNAYIVHMCIYLSISDFLHKNQWLQQEIWLKKFQYVLCSCLLVFKFATYTY